MVREFNNNCEALVNENQTKPSSPYIRGEGCGNTFLIFDCLENSRKTIDCVITEAHVCLIKEKRDDALILRLEHLNAEMLILTMIVLEPDKSVAEFCGNGARVISCFLKNKYGKQNLKYYLKTTRGLRRVWWQNDTYFVDMGRTNLHLNKSRFLNPKLETFTLGLGLRQFKFFWTETMEPHLVTFDPIHEEELHDLGLYLNHHQRSFFPLGINLNRAEITSKSTLNVTTFERGVNRITQACGTGATSCAMLARFLGHLEGNESITISLKGGQLMIQQKRGRAIMSGPAKIEV